MHRRFDCDEALVFHDYGGFMNFYDTHQRHGLAEHMKQIQITIFFSPLPLILVGFLDDGL